MNKHDKQQNSFSSFGCVALAFLLLFSSLNVHADYRQKKKPMQIKRDAQSTLAPDEDVESTTDFKPPYPFTSEELLRKLLQITALPGPVTKSDIEKTFGVKLKYREKKFNTSTTTFYEVNWGTDWYFDLNLMEDSTIGPRFYFGWGRNPNDAYPLPHESMCITIETIASALNKQGWFLKYESRADAVPPQNTYYKDGSGVIKIDFLWHTYCVMDLFRYTKEPATVQF